MSKGSSKSAKRTQRRHTTIKSSLYRSQERGYVHSDRKKIGKNPYRDRRRKAENHCDWCRKPITKKNLTPCNVTGVWLDLCPRDTRRYYDGAFRHRGIMEKHDTSGAESLASVSDIEINIGLRAQKIKAAKDNA